MKRERESDETTSNDEQEDAEMLVPHSELVEAPQQMEVEKAEAASTVENQPVENPPSSRFSWTIKKFSRLTTKKHYSDVFMVGSYKWRVLIFPKGNKVDHLSMYLDAVDSTNFPYKWSRYAQFSLAIVNQVRSKCTLTKDSQHRFTAQESDWGFTKFMPLSELYDPGRGYLVNDTCIVEAEVIVGQTMAPKRSPLEDPCAGSDEEIGSEDINESEGEEEEGKEGKGATDSDSNSDESDEIPKSVSKSQENLSSDDEEEESNSDDEEESASDEEESTLHPLEVCRNNNHKVARVDSVSKVGNQPIGIMKDQEEIEHTKKQKTEAGLYTIIKVARNEDLFEQIGKDIYFDLVDYDKVCSFCIPNQMPFNLFKEEVAKTFGVPVKLQRFWLWAKRKNDTYRPHRSLTRQEETQSVEQLVQNNVHNAELKLFLEVKVATPDQTTGDMLLFFKHYDPEKEELRYLGSFFVKSRGKPYDIFRKLKDMVGFDVNQKIGIYKEIKFESKVMCKPLNRTERFDSQLQNGDIIFFQKHIFIKYKQRYMNPDVPSFLEYVHSWQVVHFRALGKSKEENFCLKLSRERSTYDDITKRVAHHLGLDGRTKIRITPHNGYTQQPTSPLKCHSQYRLCDMLRSCNQTYILYYEVLDVLQPTLEDLETKKVAFHHATKYEVVIHSIKLPEQSTVSDVIKGLKTKVDLSHPHTELRLFEVSDHKIYKIFSLDEKIEKVDDKYRTLRAEEIPVEEKNLGPHDRLIRVHHFMRNPSQNLMQVNFGDPFLLIIDERDTLAKVKLRIQKKLQVPDEEFVRWKFAYFSLCQPRPMYLQDSNIVYSLFQRKDESGALQQHLGLEHSDSPIKRASTANQGINHKPIKKTYKRSRGISLENNAQPCSNSVEAEPQSVIGPEVGHCFNEVNSAQTRADSKRNESLDILLEAAEVIQLTEQLPVQSTKHIQVYASAGQLFEEGRNHTETFDEKFEDIGGFKILKTQALLYKQIWLKYGHIASSQILTASYIGQVTMVSEIMKTITEMNEYRLADLSLATIGIWEEKIKMVELLKFNVTWLRERFENVKRDFLNGENLKTMLVEEKLKSVSDAKLQLVMAEDKLKMAQDELKIAQEKVSTLETSLGPLLSEQQIYLEKSKRSLFDGLF